MALPSASSILTLDYIDWSLPVLNVDAKQAVNSNSLDIIDWALPSICQAAASTTSESDPSNVLYLKTGASTWSEVNTIYLKTGTSTWSEVDMYVKDDSGWNV